MEPDSSTNNQPQITYRLIARRTPFLSLPSPPPPLSPFILSTPLSLTSPPSHLPLSLLSRFSSSSFSISPAPRRPLSLPLSSFSSLSFFLSLSSFFLFLVVFFFFLFSFSLFFLFFLRFLIFLSFFVITGVDL